MNKLEYIKENIAEVRDNIDRACKKNGRSLDDIQLIAVSKTVNAEILSYAYDLGITCFGENKVQELLPKQQLFNEIIINKKVPNWHMVGHLQSNKVKYIINKVGLIHSCDGVKLINEINKRSRSSGVVTDILIEINIAKESSKHGVFPEEVNKLLYEVCELDSISIKGLMCIAPNIKEPEENRKYFAKMKSIFNEVKSIGYTNTSMEYLSMGMTNDYKVAIEEGANLVRIGTGIFGKR